MADFSTFDLGKVLQTASTLQAAQRASQDDVLRQKYMSGQIAGQQQEQQQNATTFQTQQDIAGARQAYLQAGAILQSSDPVSTAKLYAPKLVQAYEQQNGAGSFAQATGDAVKQFAQKAQPMLAAHAGIQPEIQWQDTGSTLTPIDKLTGHPIAGLAPVAKTASPDAQLSATTSTANNAVTAATARRGQDQEGQRADARLKAENIRAGFLPDGTLDPKFDSTVQAILDYRQAPYAGATNRGPGPSIMAEVQRQDPTYDATQYPAKQAALKSLMAGKDGQTLDQVNTAVAHLAQLKPLLAALNSGDIGIINSAKQAYQQATGNPAPTDASIVANMAAGEVNKVVTGGPGAEGDRDLARNMMQLKGSPAQQTEGMDNIMGLMAGRLNSVQNRFQQAKLGQVFDRMLMPETKAVLAAHGGSAVAPATGSATTATTAPPVVAPPSNIQSLLDKYK